MHLELRPGNFKKSQQFVTRPHCSKFNKTSRRRDFIPQGHDFERLWRQKCLTLALATNLPKTSLIKSQRKTVKSVQRYKIRPIGFIITKLWLFTKIETIFRIHTWFKGRRTWLIWAETERKLRVHLNSREKADLTLGNPRVPCSIICMATLKRRCLGTRGGGRGAKPIPQARLNVALFIETLRTPNPCLRRSSVWFKAASRRKWRNARWARRTVNDSPSLVPPRDVLTPFSPRQGVLANTPRSYLFNASFARGLPSTLCSSDWRWFTRRWSSTFRRNVSRFLFAFLFVGFSEQWSGQIVAFSGVSLMKFLSNLYIKNSIIFLD